MEKHYFIVSVMINEWDSENVAIFETFDEARAYIPNVCDWYCPKGSGTIFEIDNKFKVLNRWHFFNNNLRGEKN